jgi:MFS family permease
VRNLRPYLELLSENRDFRRLYVAQLISLGGDWFATVALLGLAQDLTGSGLATGTILAANMLPFFLLSPAAGVVVDRFNRKRLMITADVARAFLALGMLLVRSPGTLWIGIASLAAIATFGAFFNPASQAALPNLVTSKQLGRANVLIGASWGTMLAVGAAVGGWVAFTFGRETAFIANGVSFLISAGLIVVIKGRFARERPARTEVHPIRDIREGLSYARSHPQVTALIATKGGFGMGAGVIALLPIFATDVFHAGDLGIGVLFAGRGLGALLGPFAARAFVQEQENRLFIAIGAAMGFYGLTYAIFPAMPVLWMAAVTAGVAHLGGGAQWMMSTYGLQRFTPDHVRGRIFAFDFGLVTLSMSISLMAAGYAAEKTDPRTVMLALAGIEMAYAAVWTLATRRLWSQARRRLPVPAHLPGEGMPPAD